MKFKLLYFLIPLFLLSCRQEEPLEDPIETPTPPPTFSQTEIQIINWFENQQLSNGLLESVERGNIVSLYDNALAALVFMLKEDYNKAEKIFDYFNGQIESELRKDVGGFAQFRDSNGVAGNHRWMGDNAWLLIALNNYKAQTGNTTYDLLSKEIADWLISLQDSDGGLFAGYNASNFRLNYKVSEGNIDAFNAIPGYTDFHVQLLDFLEKDRWDETDRNLVAWPTNPPYLYAMDLHPWSYMIFEDYPISALTSADRYVNTQSTVTGSLITGYCFDEDKDAVWLEGTGQMATAFGLADMEEEKEFYLAEMEKILLASSFFPESSGFPYASNLGTTYGTDPLWKGAESNIAISGGAWYIFAKQGFNPFEVGRKKEIPVSDIFWQD
ncbi:MAG: hypothetical protein AAFY71_02945 [Bacteroidota bacterium]